MRDCMLWTREFVQRLELRAIQRVGESTITTSTLSKVHKFKDFAMRIEVCDILTTRVS